MREIVIDTEITGLDPTEGHRAVEIGAVELINHLQSAAEVIKAAGGSRLTTTRRAVNHDHDVGAGGVSGCAPSIDG
jgi:DNA polymerase III epsilon subunit-like protein